MLQDPSAEAWRLVVKGTGDLAFDRLEIEVVTSDVAPRSPLARSTTASRRHDGPVGYADGPRRAAGCHATLHVCIDRTGSSLPKNGNGASASSSSVADAAGPTVDQREHGRLAKRAVRARLVDRYRRVRLVADLTERGVRRRGDVSRDAGGPGRNRTATAEGEGFTDLRAHHLPNRPTMVEMRDSNPGLRDANAALSQLSYIPTGVTRQTGWTGREV